MKLGDNKETGMHITGKIETMKEDVRRDYKTCALVGNGPGLRADGVADAIDRHEAVFRFNAYNLGQREGKMQDNNTHFAGTKQTFRMFNKKRSIIPEIWGLKPAPEGETWLFWHYGSAMYYKAANAANPQNVYFLSVPAINHEIDSYFAIRKDVAELGLGEELRVSDEFTDWITRDYVSDDDVRRRQLVWVFLRHENVRVEERHDIAEGQLVARVGGRYGYVAFVALV